MKYNLEQGFTFLKYDPHRLKKLTVVSLFSLLALGLLVVPPIAAAVSKTFNFGVLAIIAVCFISAILLLFAISGYSFKLGQDRLRLQNAAMPELSDFWGLVFIGFKSALGSIMYYIPVIVLGFIAGIIEVIATGGAHAASATGGNGLTMLIEAVYNILYLIFIFFFFAMNANFMEDFNTFSYLDFSRAFKRMKGNFVNYIILVAVLLALGVVFNIVCLILCITIVGVLLVPFIVIYVQFVTMEMTAQYIKVADNKEE